MFTYPLDKKTKDGKLFWSQPKRPPVAIDYDQNHSLSNMFIVSYACLYARVNNIEIEVPESVRKQLGVDSNAKVNVRDEKVQKMLAELSNQKIYAPFVPS